jgi:CheY-like chemotaxis protein
MLWRAIPTRCLLGDWFFVALQVNSVPVALLVEDDWLIREDLAFEMRSAGWLILEAGTGHEALAQLYNGAAIDVLITDIQLSGPMTGWEVAKSFRAIHPSVPVIYVSGNSLEPTRMVAGGLFFSKPYDPAEIAETCRTLNGFNGANL